MTKTDIKTLHQNNEKKEKKNTGVREAGLEGGRAGSEGGHSRETREGKTNRKSGQQDRTGGRDTGEAGGRDTGGSWRRGRDGQCGGYLSDSRPS